MQSFKKVRVESRQLWLEKTARKRYINDITVDALECNWQINLVRPNMHNSFFCSLGEWNTHITDMLCETTFDNYDFVTPRYNRALFRYYTRLFLIASEVITDFQDFIMYVTEMNQADTRILLSDPQHSFSVQNFFTYVNTICKHKSGQRSLKKYHWVNHHIDYVFLDSLTPSKTSNITINNLGEIELTGHEAIEVPKIKDLITQILHCYEITDNVLNRIPQGGRSKLERYEREI